MGHCLASSREIAFLNIYGPCSDRKRFWSHLDDSGILSIPSLIVGGDLNIILSATENWGGSYVPGATEYFYRNIFVTNKLTDILPAQLVPTWRNGRSGPDAIARRLDRFLVAEEYLSSTVFSASRVELPYFSDHSPILLQLRPPDRIFSSPFKFNHNWTLETGYNLMVTTVWNDPCFNMEDNAQRRLTWKLKVIKDYTRSWFHKKKKEEQARLNTLEHEIIQAIKKSTISALSTEEADGLKLL
jgi:hypothetical protein